MAALRAPFDGQDDHRDKDRGDDDARNKHDQGFLHRAHDYNLGPAVCCDGTLPKRPLDRIGSRRMDGHQELSSLLPEALTQLRADYDRLPVHEPGRRLLATFDQTRMEMDLRISAAG